ncbi:hypothetical protein LZ30DRAFT_691964 [Colletotrichum cereale]|nr:hypothetical protein LZ30DRAFT_691964 [Colletotrichum cereale]
MSSTTPQQGSVGTNSSTRTITTQEARDQSDARIQAFLSDQALRLHGTVATQQRSSSPVTAAIANVDQVGLGSGGGAAGGATGQPVDTAPIALRGIGSQSAN